MGNAPYPFGRLQAFNLQFAFSLRPDIVLDARMIKGDGLVP